MKAKKRTVRFYEPILKTPEGETKYLPDTFWKSFLQYASTIDQGERDISYRGRTYLGVANFHAGTGHDYLYIGKRRPKGDYPDDVDDNGDAVSVALNQTVKSLVEPAYIVPTGKRLIVAVLRSSGGPSPEALEAWLSAAANFDVGEDSLKLAAVAQDDKWERLQHAQLVSKIEFRVEPDVVEDLGEGEFSLAVKKVMDLSERDASLNLTISFGSSLPDTLAGQSFTARAKDFLRGSKYSKAKATTKIQNADGKWATDEINFVHEIVTHSVRVGDSEDVPLTPDLVLPEISRAIDEFRSEF